MAYPARQGRGALSDLLERAAALRRDGTPFVMATVVRSLKPASAKPGDRALVFADGTRVGWVGGGCVHEVLQREACTALSQGTPRLIRLSPTPSPEEGVFAYPMTCHSGGTLDIYLEPVLPAAQVVVLGESPVADALVELAQPLGFRVVRSLEHAGDEDVWVVAAAMSSAEDHPAARAALERGVPYVAMVASRRRTEAFKEELRADGISDEVLERLKAPAGLDIGAATGAEIALSILAEIVQRRRSLPRRRSAPPTREVAIDPICGMEVEIASARWTAERDGETFYFCAPGCRKTFIGQPAPDPGGRPR